MNKERLAKLREQLLNLPGKFAYYTMGEVMFTDEYIPAYKNRHALQCAREHQCKTSACVAGWCMILNDEHTNGNLSNADNFAKDYLDLTYEEMRFLFYPNNQLSMALGFIKEREDKQTYYDYNLQDAIDRIDFLLSDKYVPIA
jgi:hypothetical protein